MVPYDQLFDCRLGCGSIGVLVGQPVDTFRVRLQIGPNNSKPASGFLSLCRGVVPPLMIAGVVNALNFGVYQVIQSKFEQRHSKPSSTLPLWNHLLSGFGAGAGISIITSPFLTLKVQQQARGGGLLATASHLVHAEGTRGLFRGFGAHFVADSVGRGVYMMVYESLKRSLVGQPSDSVPYARRLVAGAGAGMSSWLVIYPADVVRSRLFALGPGLGKSMDVAECVRHVYREHGFRGFFKGLSLTMLTAGPIAAVVLPTYDFIFDLLQTSKLSLVLAL